MSVPPAVVLFFLSAAVAELLSGSAPPSEFFNPVSFVLLSCLYGSGAVLARELKVRWNKGYVSLFVLGAAYAIIEEGLMVKSFFDPTWMDIGILGVYGRWQGINWVWTEWLTIYHAIFSIAIPVTLVELLYLNQRNQSWINNKKFAGLAVLLAGVTAFGYLFLTPYRVPFLQYGFFVLVVAFLVFVAWKIPSTTGKGKLPVLSPKKATVAGFVTGMGFFFFFGGGPNLIDNPLVLLLVGAGLVYLVFSFLRKYNWNKNSLYQKFALSAGALMFLIVLTPFQEFDSSRPDNPQGMLIVGLVTLGLLFLLRKRLKRTLNSQNFEQTLKKPQ
jgi:hypothetical protein